MLEPVSSKRKKRVKYPEHAVQYRVLEAALDVSSTLFAKLRATLDLTHELQERLRQAREDDRSVARPVRAGGGEHKFITKADQYKAISALVASDPRFRCVHSQVLQDVADRVERGTKRWLKGQGGPLRPQPRKRHRSFTFTFTQYGFAAKIVRNRLGLSKLGDARLMGLRKLPGRPKAVTIVFKQGRFFAQILCEVQLQHTRRRDLAEVQALPDNGLDTGLARVATLADGTVFEPAKPLKAALVKLACAQRHMSRKFEARKKGFKRLDLCGPLPERDPRQYSNRLKGQIKRVAVRHTRVANTRRDQQRKIARRIESTCRCLGVEVHGLEFMKRNRRLARTVSDVAPGNFLRILEHAMGPGRYVAVANRRAGIGGNSQTCVCGESVPKTLKDRWHTCPKCELSVDRDVMSANIAMDMAFGYSVVGPRRPPVPGQGVVKRGEGEGETGKPVAAECPAMDTVEPSAKRQSSTGRSRQVRITPGAKATVSVNTSQSLGTP